VIPGNLHHGKPKLERLCSIIKSKAIQSNFGEEGIEET
jgi:hypothetical protein